MSGWAWSGKWRYRTPGYPDPGSPEGPAPSLWEQRGGVSAGRLPAAGLPCRLCTTRWPQGARSPFPQPGPCDQTPQAGKACTPAPAGGLHAAAGGWPGSPGPHPTLVAWCCCSGKKESVCVFTSLVQGGESRAHSAGGACSDAPAGGGRETRVGRGTQAIWPPEQTSQQKQGGHGVPAQRWSHAACCVSVCVWAPGPPPRVEGLGAALSLERSPQLEPGGCGERVWVAEPRPRREPRTDAPGRLQGCRAGQ